MVECALRICMFLDLEHLIWASRVLQLILLRGLGNHLLALLVLLDFGISFIVVYILTNMYPVSSHHHLTIPSSRKDCIELARHCMLPCMTKELGPIKLSLEEMRTMFYSAG